MKEKAYATDLSPRECQEKLRDRQYFHYGKSYVIAVRNRRGRIRLLPSVIVYYDPKFDVVLKGKEIAVTYRRSVYDIIGFSALLFMTAVGLLTALISSETGGVIAGIVLVCLFGGGFLLGLWSRSVFKKKAWKLVEQFLAEQLNTSVVD